MGVTERVRRAGSFPCLSPSFSLLGGRCARADSSQFRKAASRALAPCCWICLVWSQNTISKRLHCLKLNCFQYESRKIMERFEIISTPSKKITLPHFKVSPLCFPSYTSQPTRMRRRSALSLEDFFSKGK